MTDLWISFTPLDTLFFRDGRPFSMGEETWADGIFPPPPSVFLGAMRSAVLSLQPENYATIANHDPTSDISIKNIHLSYSQPDKLRFFPPGDLVRKKCENDRRDVINRPFLLTLKQNNNNNNYPLDYLLSNIENREIENYPTYYFLDAPSFSEYLKGEKVIGNPSKISIHSEPKIGIGRTKLINTVIDGKLYRVGMQRFEDYKGNKVFFSVQYTMSEETASLIKNNRLSFIKIGGENKVAEAIIKEDLNPRLNLPTFSAVDRFFKIVLTTPTIFKNGWIPDFIDPKNYTGTFQGIRIKLIAAMTGKPQAFGGFDMLSKAPKPLVKAVPPGSVFFFQIIEDSQSIEAFATSLKGPFCISKERKNEGFGLAYLGKVNSQINPV